MIQVHFCNIVPSTAKCSFCRHPPPPPPRTMVGRLSLAGHGKYRTWDKGDTGKRSQGTGTQNTDTGRKGTAGGAKPAQFCRDAEPGRATGPRAHVFLRLLLTLFPGIWSFPWSQLDSQLMVEQTSRTPSSCKPTPKAARGCWGAQAGRRSGPGRQAVRLSPHSPAVSIPRCEFVRLQSGAAD